MKKIMSGLLVSGILLGFSVPTFAAELDSKNGKTTLEITDYTVDPETGLPSDPGAFTLLEVPNIDFGQYSLDSIPGEGRTFDGTYDQDLQVKDTRPTQASITEALATIESVVPTEGKVTQEQIDTSKTNWTNAVAASDWEINAQATDLTGNATSLKIGDNEVLTSAGTVVTEAATAPVGTKSYELDSPTLTISNNQLSVQKYEGTITYTAVIAL